MKNAIITILAAMLPALLSAAQIAERVGINGRIYTMNQAQPWAEAIAIKGDTIIYVGDDKGVKAFIGPNTIVGDMKGKLMLPGFIDTHMHMLPMCVFSSGCVISFTTDKVKMLAELKAFVDANPDGPYYSYGGAFSGAVDIHKDEILIHRNNPSGSDFSFLKTFETFFVHIHQIFRLLHGNLKIVR